MAHLGLVHVLILGGHGCLLLWYHIVHWSLHLKSLVGGWSQTIERNQAYLVKWIVFIGMVLMEKQLEEGRLGVHGDGLELTSLIA